MSGGGTGRPETPRDRDPWRVLINVAQIPETGLHREIVADETARKLMAEVAELREVISAHAEFDVQPKRDGSYHVTGQVQARIGQTCVVTLDPIENEIIEPIDVVFAPPEQIPEMSDLVDDAEEGDEETPDPPEPITGGFIDIGRLATDALFLGIDPYPRKADAVFEQQVEAPDPENHPFAALKALQPKQDGKKPKS
ncbi:MULTISPECIES: DUF177 domain-containing protein [Bradyrhizobium]|jgi:hypothetical protein|uniref:YceD family protein n=1 Tax=Bradyrhizobium TaxID=374 RepID=UPI0003FCC289|nr:MULTISPECIES: DUF177 domain-containing protein [Bradyrhizobium]MBK5656488.1 DUF177 domain-containing protein [Rhizobium sp.]OCX31054.1 phosphodiesterase [Bradyrhizobium sp. UASWS1016]